MWRVSPGKGPIFLSVRTSWNHSRTLSSALGECAGWRHGREIARMNRHTSNTEQVKNSHRRVRFIGRLGLVAGCSEYRRSTGASPEIVGHSIGALAFRMTV